MSEIKSIDIKFYCIDFWSRPIFEVIDKGFYVGSVDTLFPDKDKAPNGTSEEISEYFRNHLNELTIFGSDIDDDPLGTNIRKDITINII